MDGPATSARISRWGVVVMASALLVVGGAVALAIASVTSSHERKVSFAVRGSLSGVALDLGDADVLIAGGGQRSVLGVQRTDRYAFGHDAEVQRRIVGAELRIHSRCPNARAARLLGALSRGRARQRPGDGAHGQRHGRASRATAARRASRRAAATSTSPASAGSRCRRARRAATSPRAPRARPSSSRCARRRARCTCPCPRAATRSRPRARRARHSVRGLDAAPTRRSRSRR